MKRKIVIGIVVFFVMKISCSRYDVSISNLPRHELNFQELPQDVQTAFSCTPSYGGHLLDDKYFEESTQLILAPWIYEPWLFDAARKITYKMDSEPTTSYVVFKGRFYQPSEQYTDSYVSYELRAKRLYPFQRFFVRLTDRLKI